MPGYGGPQLGFWNYHGQQGGFGGMPSSGGMPGYGGPQLGFWNRPQLQPGHWGQPLSQPGYWAQPHVVNNPPVQDGPSGAEEAASPGYGAGFTQDRVGGPWSFAQGNVGVPGMMPTGMGMMPPAMGMMSPAMGMMPPAMGMTPPGMGMTPPGMGMTPSGIGMGLGMTPASMVPGMNMGMAQGMGFGMNMMPGMNTGMTQAMGMGLGMGMGSGMSMMPQAFGGMVPGLGGMGMLGLMNLLGGGEDLMEDARDQNSDDLGADEYLTSSKARLEKYLQKQWQLGKRKLQVQVDFGNVPLEWEYLNQYHGLRHPLAMTAFGPKYGLDGPPSPMYDYGYGPVQQGRPPMPSSFFGQQTPGFWQQPQFGPAPPVQQPEAPVQVDESVQQREATQ